MPFGADDLIGVVGLSLTCLHGCVQGLAILSKAIHFDRDVSNIRLQIELEQNLLFTWAEAAGLTQEPPTLLISANDAPFVPKILGQLEILLSDLNQLKKRYGLDLKSTFEDVETLDDDDNSTLSKLGPKPQESVRRAHATIFHQRKYPWKKLRWVTIDEKKVGKLLEEVKGYTARLEKFLEQPMRAKRAGDLDGILRDAVLNLNDYQKLDIIGREFEQASSKIAIAAAVRLKQTRLMLGLSDSSLLTNSARIQSGPFELTSGQKLNVRRSSKLQSSSNSSNTMRLSMRLLSMSREARANGLRTLTHHNKRAVLLEWKIWLEPDSAVLETRVNQVAAFLHKLEPSFHSLPCRGFVLDHDARRYGYIFDLPENFQLASLPAQPSQGQPFLSPLPNMRSLRQLFDQSLTAPSLNERLSISVTLLETLLNLHTSGWLHKELRSENIIFIRKADGVGDDDVDLSTYSTYVAGYVYARADDPGEMTEPLKSDLEADLYRHPLSLGSSRLSFRKSFDIFSVGCTLLEIGLWSNLRQILEQHSERLLPLGLQTEQQRRSLQKSSTFSSTSTSASILGRPADNDDEKGDNDKEGDTIRPSLDLMRLRYQLLLSQLPVQNGSGTKSNFQETALRPRNRGKILRSLEAATGNMYTSIVEELLSTKVASCTGKEADFDEHEYALDLEIKARDTIQAIANAI